MDKKPRYTFIQHGIRERYKISANEYIIMDSVYKLSRHTGRCESSREYLAKFLGITKQGVIKLIDRLEEKGILEKDEEGKLKVSIQWEDETVFNGKQSLPKAKKSGKQSLQNGKQSLPNNKYIISKDIYLYIEGIYQNEFKKKTGATPDYQYGCDRKILGRYIKQYGKEKTGEIIKAYIQGGAGEWCGYSIGGLSRSINKVLIQINKTEVTGGGYDIKSLDMS